LKQLQKIIKEGEHLVVFLNIVTFGPSNTYLIPIKKIWHKLYMDKEERKEIIQKIVIYSHLNVN